jgi:hypothetical protein
MASVTLIPQRHTITDPFRNGHFLVVNEITHNSSDTTTIVVPGGLVDAEVLFGTTGNTDPTVTVTQGNDIYDVNASNTDSNSDGIPDASGGGTQPTVALAGGSSGTFWVVSRHTGNAGGL